MHIFNNFTELLSCQDLKKLNEKLFSTSQLCQKEFDKIINLTILEKEEYLKLNNYIEEILKEYPQLVPHIVDSTKNKNRYSKLENFNHRNDEHFVRLLNEKRLLDAALLYATNEHTRLEVDNINKHFFDIEIADMYGKIKYNSAQLATRELVSKDIETLLILNFEDIIPIRETIVNLAKFITEELILRTNVPDDYVFSHDYCQSIELSEEIKFEKIRNIHKIIRNLFIQQNKTPEEILEFLNNELR